MTRPRHTTTEQESRRVWRFIGGMFLAIPLGIVIGTLRHEASIAGYFEDKEQRAAIVNYYNDEPKLPECSQLAPEIRRFPEIGRLLSLVQPPDCAIYRSAIPAGTILSAPGTYLAVKEGFHNQQGKGDAANLANLETAKRILAEAGWREDATSPRGGVNREHAEFRRILADGTRQYLHLEMRVILALKVISLPTPRVTLTVPEPSRLVSHSPSPDDDRFAELPPGPGFVHQSLSYVGSNQYYTPADPAAKRGDNSWWAPSWARTYQYDAAKTPAQALTLLYRDALRDAGWQIGRDFNFQGMPDSPHLSADFPEAKRELVMSLGFHNGRAHMTLVDIPFQRRVAELIRQWHTDGAALIADLDFAVGGSDLSDDAKNALEALLEARLVDGRQGREDFVPDVMLELRGRADPSGTRKNNLDLALARANSVKTWLVEHRVPSESLGVSTFGEWPTGDGEEGLPRRTVSVAKLGYTPKAVR